MTKNEAYLYAKNIRRLGLTHKQLEERMSKEGYSESDAKMVRYWLSHGRTGV